MDDLIVAPTSARRRSDENVLYSDNCSKVSKKKSDEIEFRSWTFEFRIKEMKIMPSGSVVEWHI
jgi:hypothetical protein